VAGAIGGGADDENIARLKRLRRTIGWHFKLSMTSSMWRSLPRRWEKQPEKMPHKRRRLIPRFTALKIAPVSRRSWNHAPWRTLRPTAKRASRLQELAELIVHRRA